VRLAVGVRRTARRGGTVGLGVRYHLPSPTIIGVSSVALESELHVDLLLWQLRLKYTSAPARNWKVW